MVNSSKNDDKVKQRTKQKKGRLGTTILGLLAQGKPGESVTILFRTIRCALQHNQL
jgi:hypothetical protein